MCPSTRFCFFCMLIFDDHKNMIYIYILLFSHFQETTCVTNLPFISHKLIKTNTVLVF